MPFSTHVSRLCNHTDNLQCDDLESHAPNRDHKENDSRTGVRWEAPKIEDGQTLVLRLNAHSRSDPLRRRNEGLNPKTDNGSEQVILTHPETDNGSEQVGPTLRECAAGLPDTMANFRRRSSPNTLRKYLRAVCQALQGGIKGLQTVEGTRRLHLASRRLPPCLSCDASKSPRAWGATRAAKQALPRADQCPQTCVAIAV